VTPELISEVPMAPVLVGRDKTKPTPVVYRGPPDLVARLTKAAKALNLSRNEAMTQLLKFALEEHEREQAKKSKAKR
jgi:hypothetical protein